MNMVLIALAAFLLLGQKKSDNNKQKSIIDQIGDSGLLGDGAKNLMDSFSKLNGNGDKTGAILELLSNPVVFNMFKNILFKEKPKEKSEEFWKGENPMSNSGNDSQAQKDSGSSAQSENSQSSQNSQKDSGYVWDDNEAKKNDTAQNNSNMAAKNETNENLSNASKSQENAEAQTNSVTKRDIPKPKNEMTNLPQKLSQESEAKPTNEMEKSKFSDEAKELFKPVERIAGVEISEELYHLYDGWYVR